MDGFAALAEACEAIGCRFAGEVRRILPRYEIFLEHDDDGPRLRLVVGHDDEVRVAVVDSNDDLGNLLLEIRFATVERDQANGCWIPGESRHQQLLAVTPVGWRLMPLPAHRLAASIPAARTLVGLDDEKLGVN